jgi:hypothetical protein
MEYEYKSLNPSSGVQLKNAHKGFLGDFNAAQ